MTATDSKASRSSRTAKFRYEAVALDGSTVKGTIQATSSNAARNELAVQGMRVLDLRERKGLQTEITREKVPLVDVMHFSRQMATFLRSGVPVTEALDTLRQDTKSDKMAAVLGDVLERVGTGSTLADAMGAHDEVFPSYYLSLLRAGELTGRMEEAFDQLHAYIKRDIELSRAIRKALIYPAILLVVALAVSLLIVLFVIPRFAEFFEEFDAELPLPTRILMGIADFVSSPLGLAIMASVGVAVLVFVLWIQSERGRLFWHRVLLRLPGVGTVLTYAATERFCRVLASLLDAGVALPEALPSAVDCTNNLVFKERLDVAMDKVLAGEGFSGPLRATELFPVTATQMIRVGERTGALSEQLEGAATFFKEELDYSVEKLTQWFEPIVIVFIGVVVGFVALAMVSAMYGIYNQVDL
jgi:type IV pilus assembly protein PilC